VSEIRTQEVSQLWGVAIGLSKLQGDQNQIRDQFLQVMESLKAFDSDLDKKMMAAEIIVASGTSSFQSLEQDLATLDKQLRNEHNVPQSQSIGIAATLLYGKNRDTDTYPMDRFRHFQIMTDTPEVASMLAISNVDADTLGTKFHDFEAIFEDAGFTKSEDREIASAYLAISPVERDDETRSKISIFLDGIRRDLAFPLVPVAILMTIPDLEPHEILDLVEKAVSVLGQYTKELGRSELVSLAVRMIHGVNNELIKQINPQAKISNTPIQFTSQPYMYGGYYPMIWWYYPIIIAHYNHYAIYRGYSNPQAGHSHGIGGFFG
jgi:hypothetical protein